MTEDISTRLSPILQAARKAEEEMNVELRNVIREVILDKIEKSQGSLLEKPIDIAFKVPLILFPKSKIAYELSKETLDSKNKEKAEYMPIYNEVNFMIDLMSGRQLYWVLENLRGERPLDKVLKVILRNEAKKYGPLKYEVIPSKETIRYALVPSEYKVILSKEAQNPTPPEKSDKQGNKEAGDSEKLSA